MSFQITITETNEVTRKKGKEWVVLGTKEVERERTFCAPKDEPQTRIENIMGYPVQDVEETRTVETKIFEQTVQTLSLSKVICAINNLQ